MSNINKYDYMRGAFPLTAGTNATNGKLVYTGKSVNDVANALKETGDAYIESLNKQQAVNLRAQAQSALQAQEFSAKEAQKNRDFQLMMSNTAYQRAMADMKRAGLNPILAYRQGGASSMSGSTAQGYTINGASGQSNGLRARMSIAPDVLETIEHLRINAFSRAQNNKQWQNAKETVKEALKTGKQMLNEMSYNYYKADKEINTGKYPKNNASHY